MNTVELRGQSWKKKLAPLLAIPRHFLARLRETPLLAGWLILGTLAALGLHGWNGLVQALLNLALVSVYAVIIHWMTLTPPQPVPIRRPRFELAIGLVVLGLTFLVQLLDFGVWPLQPFQGWLRALFSGIYRAIADGGLIPAWAVQDVYLAASSTIKQLIPTLLLFSLLGYRLKAMGVNRLWWKLTALLTGSALLFGILTGYLFRAPLGQVIVLFFIGILINALPEELFFRGYLLPRLEAWLGDGLNALVFSALLFNLLHVPVEVANGAPPLTAFLDVISLAYPSGLIWGYLYLRTRSVLPGMLWHAANATLGFLLLSF